MVSRPSENIYCFFFLGDSGDAVRVLKHWLKSPLGVPVKATIKPPREGLVPNGQRSSNPFTKDAEPDWIQQPDIRRSSQLDRKPPAPPPRQGTFGSEASSSQSPLGRNPPSLPPRTGTFGSEASSSSQSPIITERGERNSTAPAPAPKSPPAIPRKPIKLSSQNKVPQAGGSRSSPSPSPSTSTPAPTNGATMSRASTMDLLGDSTNESIEWKPLLPQ